MIRVLISNENGPQFRQDFKRQADADLCVATWSELALMARLDVQITVSAVDPEPARVLPVVLRKRGKTFRIHKRSLAPRAMYEAAL